MPRWSSYSPSPPRVFSGDPLTNHNPFTVSSYLAHTGFGACARWLLSLDARAAKIIADGPSPSDQPTPEQASSAFAALPGDLTNRILRLLKFGLLATMAGVIEAVGLLQTLFEAQLAAYTDVVLPILETMSATVRGQVESALSGDPELLILWQAVMTWK